MLSSGVLPMAKEIKLSKQAIGLQFTWNAEAQYDGDQYDDLVMIALYAPLTESARYI